MQDGRQICQILSILPDVFWIEPFDDKQCLSNTKLLAAMMEIRFKMLLQNLAKSSNYGLKIGQISTLFRDMSNEIALY